MLFNPEPEKGSLFKDEPEKERLFKDEFAKGRLYKDEPERAPEGHSKIARRFQRRGRVQNRTASWKDA